MDHRKGPRPTTDGDAAASTGDSLYGALRVHLDRGPVPFPPSLTGVDLRLLRSLFSPADATIALELSALPEPVSTIARRLARPDEVDDVRRDLEGMANRGIIHQTGPTGRERYGKLPFAVGIYELQVDHLTADLERDARQYFDEEFGQAFRSSPTRQMRTVPVGAAFRATSPVASTADVRAMILASPGPFAVLRCICRHGKDLLGEPCRTTTLRENCLTLGSGAETMMRRGAAHPVGREEMLALVERANTEGLVLQTQNAAAPSFICCCCGCCCNVLTSARRLPQPASRFASTHRAEVVATECSTCGTCTERCPMQAIGVDTGGPVVDLDRCIGCGLCVTSCTSGAFRLAEREDASLPPAHSGALYTRLFRERYGLIGTAVAIGRHLLGRKF